MPASKAPRDSKWPDEVHVRWMERLDLKPVLRIEDDCFEFPWQEDDFVRCLQCPDNIGLVAELEGSVVGCVIYALHKSRLEMLNLAVDPMVQRRHVGTVIIDKLKGKLSDRRRTSITAEVRETNVVAQQFFAGCGFRAVKITNDFYEDTDEAAYGFRYRLPASVGETKKIHHGVTENTEEESEDLHID